MTLYGLRLLVALLTFAVGSAAAWLFSSAPSKTYKLELGSSSSPAVTTVTVITDATKTRSCSLESRRVVQGGILQGKAISMPKPAYPQAAKDARVSGTVVVQIEVDEDGRVAKAEAVRGPELLREAAEEAALLARYAPTKLSGEPVRVSGVITYNFVLD